MVCLAGFFVEVLLWQVLKISYCFMIFVLGGIPIQLRFFVFITALLLRGILFDFSYTCMAHCLMFPFSFFVCQHLLFCCHLLSFTVLAVLCPIKYFGVVVLSCQVSLQLNYRVRCIFMDDELEEISLINKKPNIDLRI